jgi:hypothetical protein
MKEKGRWLIDDGGWRLEIREGNLLIKPFLILSFVLRHEKQMVEIWMVSLLRKKKHSGVLKQSFLSYGIYKDCFAPESFRGSQ